MNRITQPFNALSMAERFTAEGVDFECAPRFNIAGGARVAAIVDEGDGRVVTALRWGMIPFWTPNSDVEAGHRLFTARSETLTQRAAFRTSLLQRRCIVPIGGWFHPTRREGRAATFSIRPRQSEIWSVAALWDEWVTPDGRALHTMAMVTTESNNLLAPLRARMPAILRREDEAAWLDAANSDARALTRLLRPHDSRAMQIEAVRAPRWAAQDDASLLQARDDSSAVLCAWGLQSAVKVPQPRRAVRRDWVSPDGQIFFRARSFTREDGTRWHPVVDCHEGGVWCDCPDFRFRHARHEPNIHTPIHWCKHLARAVDNCVRHGDLQLAV